ncbi:MAG: hypothetical protein MHM6MM_004082 [Cercozoa sp. M6MM]
MKLLPWLTIGSLAVSAFATSFDVDLQRTLEDVKSMEETTQKLATSILSGHSKGDAYERLKLMTNRGPRMGNSKNLADTIEHAVNRMRREGLFDNVWTMEVNDVPNWTRGDIRAEIVTPNGRTAELDVIAIGGSDPTPSGGITAKVVHVSDFEELERKGAKGELEGAIVFVNHQCDWLNRPVTCYSDTTGFRRNAAAKAAPHGAVAALVRSSGFNDDLPHTGSLYYVDGVPRIPSAALSNPSADLLESILFDADTAYNGGKTVHLRMTATNNGIKGETDEIVVFGGHIDSWDVGMGAQDDAGGFAISWAALAAIARENLRPKRTLRLVGWTSEEMGNAPGGRAYRDYIKSAGELQKHVLAMESDGGVREPRGIEFSGHAEHARSFPVMRAVSQLLSQAPLSLPHALKADGHGVDIDPITKLGVPALSLWNDRRTYFKWHHTEMDTIQHTGMNADEMDRCTAVWAVTAYAVANLEESLPRVIEV